MHGLVGCCQLYVVGSESLDRPTANPGQLQPTRGGRKAGRQTSKQVRTLRLVFSSHRRGSSPPNQPTSTTVAASQFSRTSSSSILHSVSALRIDNRQRHTPRTDLIADHYRQCSLPSLPLWATSAASLPYSVHLLRQPYQSVLLLPISPGLHAPAASCCMFPTLSKARGPVTLLWCCCALCHSHLV